MSLYRQPGRYGRGTVIGAAALAFAVGALIAFFIGRSTAPDPSLRDQIAQLRDDLQPARQGLEILPAEYAQAVRGGAASTPGEIAGVVATVKRIDAVLAEHRAELRLLAPAVAGRLAPDVAAVQRAVDAKAAPAEVERAVARAKADLAAVLDASG